MSSDCRIGTPERTSCRGCGRTGSARSSGTGCRRPGTLSLSGSTTLRTCSLVLDLAARRRRRDDRPTDARSAQPNFSTCDMNDEDPGRRRQLPPRSLNIFANTGTMNSSMPMTATMAMHEHDDRVGHRRLDLAAQLDLGLVVLRELQQHARRGSRRPRRPGIMLTISGGKTLGCLAIADATATGRSRRRCGPRPRTRRSSLFSVCSARIVSARSSERPELIIVANCRDKTARSLSLTLLAEAGDLDLLVHAGVRLR